MNEELDWVTILTTNDLAKAASAAGMLKEKEFEVRFFQLPPYEIQVMSANVEKAKALLHEWGHLT